MISEKRKQTIKLILSITILVLLFIFVAIMMIKYEVEGETNMPFKLSKIVVIGTVEGIDKEENKGTNWDIDIYQNNDVYFYIDQNEENSQDELIKSIKVDNIQITKAPQKGNVKVYMPNSKEGRLFDYDDQFLVTDKLEYHGGSESSYSNLEIGSKGGKALIGFSNVNIANYTPNKNENIIHNSSLLKKVNVKNEEICFSVSFDFTIETTKNKYKSNISLNMPVQDLDNNERCYLEKTDMSDVVFKRTK